MRRIKLIFFALIFLNLPSFAQELRCRVLIDDRQVQTTEQQVFKDLKTAITQFLNNRRWTNLTVKPEERINCNLQLTIKPTDKLGIYSAIAKIQSSRPVFGTNYETVICNHVDQSFDFEYVQAQPLDYSENSMTSNLSALLSFYAYVWIGMDQDSFSKLGGTPYFQKAQNISNLAAQQYPETRGWKAFDQDNKSRFMLIENLLNPQLTLIRESSYIYHRLGLDLFEKDPESARMKILEVLTKVKTANAQKRGSALFNIFFDSKKTELIKIFSQGNMKPRQDAYNLLAELDPVNLDKYKAIVENG